MARVEDVTDRLLADVHGPGDYVKRVHATKPAHKPTPGLIEFFTKWEQSGPNTVGRVSNALAYGKAITGPTKLYHSSMIRLIKGGHIRVCEVSAAPPPGSSAHRDAPYSDRFYLLASGTCPTEIDPASANLRGSRRRRR